MLVNRTRIGSYFARDPNRPNTLVEDGWITAKIRIGILQDSSIDPDQFKIVTVDELVYLMGDVIPAQALKVIMISRNCDGVRRVVKLFRYYQKGRATS